jgi:hypothetical protein
MSRRCTSEPSRHQRPPIGSAAEKSPFTPPTTDTENPMLTDIFPFLLPRNVEHDLSARLRRLADDLDKIREGAGPGADALAEAPLIVDWHATLTPLGLRLFGFVAGHPLLGNRPALTSQVWVADPAGQWIRTLNRFYKLGIPADENSLERLRNVGRKDAPAGRPS